MFEDYALTRTAETFLAKQREGQERAERLEGVLREVLQRVAPAEKVSLLVFDMGKGECLVALRHLRNVVQVRLWRELVDEVLVNPDAAMHHVLGRILSGALGT
jgi:hypothetical protein